MRTRPLRVGDELRRVLAEILAHDVHDPRLPAFVSITDVAMSNDLSHAKVFYSVMGDDATKQSASQALAAARGFLRCEVAKRMALRVVPELSFAIDESIDRGFAMDRLIDDVRARDRRSNPESDDDHT